MTIKELLEESQRLIDNDEHSKAATMLEEALVKAAEEGISTPTNYLTLDELSRKWGVRTSEVAATLLQLHLVWVKQVRYEYKLETTSKGARVTTIDARGIVRWDVEAVERLKETKQ